MAAKKYAFRKKIQVAVKFGPLLLQIEVVADFEWEVVRNWH